MVSIKSPIISLPRVPEFFASIIMFFLNSMLNFPIHRSQEYIPFIIIAALVFALTKNDNKSIIQTSYIVPLLLILIIPAATLAAYEHKSLIIQDRLLSDYSSNNFSLKNKLSRL